MTSDTTTGGPPSSAPACPASGGETAADASPCGACREMSQAGGTRHPAVKAVIGVAWFCTGLVILWFFGSLAMAPWQAAARQGPMPLPGGWRFDLTLGRGATDRCAVQAKRDGRTQEVVIMQGRCNRIAAHQWLTANRQLPQFQGATLGTPYTVAAPPGAQETATRTRLLVSFLFTLAAGLAGGFLVVGCTWVAARLMRAGRPRRRDAGPHGA